MADMANQEGKALLQTLPGDDVRQIMWRFADRFDLHMLVQSTRGTLNLYLAGADKLGRSGYDEVLRFKGRLARVAAAERRLRLRGDPAVAERLTGVGQQRNAPDAQTARDIAGFTKATRPERDVRRVDAEGLVAAGPGEVVVLTQHERSDQ